MFRPGSTGLQHLDDIVQGLSGLRREVVSVTKLDRLAGARTPQIHLTAQENVGLWVESDQGKDELAGLSTGAVLAYEGDVGTVSMLDSHAPQ